MKIPSHCPFCNDVMVTEYPSEDSRIFTKDCYLRVGHGIKFYAMVINDEVYKVRIRFPAKLSEKPRFATFVYTFKQLWISPGHLVLPYLEPDLSNYQELIDKLNIYILFS